MAIAQGVSSALHARLPLFPSLLLPSPPAWLAQMQLLPPLPRLLLLLPLLRLPRTKAPLMMLFKHVREESLHDMPSHTSPPTKRSKQLSLMPLHLHLSTNLR
mmetsp:Transcript_38667/g.88746  ORF Transcript_38667/g.88746 Transcript_38667/m.88746 type:complete len:102 (-) Transcript_38667:1192-1497(-)